MDFDSFFGRNEGMFEGLVLILVEISSPPILLHCCVETRDWRLVTDCCLICSCICATISCMRLSSASFSLSALSLSDCESSDEDTVEEDTEDAPTEAAEAPLEASFWERSH